MINTYLDVHVIQSVPPSNLNRDDAGSPKQAIYGGVRRARVSSQAWKRATRKAFAEGTDAVDQGTRTQRIWTILTDRLTDRTDLDRDQAARVATTLLKPLGIKAGRKETDTAYLLFFGRRQVEAIVDQIAERAGELADLDDKALEAALEDVSVRESLMNGHPLDVALFGRMVADIPALNVDAATQVAHAISTHPVELEFDYYTAVDDEKDRATDDSGAGMIGTVEFNSATLYRYATLGLGQLADNLGGSIDDTADGVRRFVDCFVRSMPTGHQNTFAHRTLPSAVVVMVREGQPVNLVSAFENPVQSHGGLVTTSINRLAAEHAAITEMWGNGPSLVATTYPVDVDDSVREAFGAPVPFSDLLDQVHAATTDRLSGDER